MNTVLKSIFPYPLTFQFWAGVLLFTSIFMIGVLVLIGLAVWRTQRPFDWTAASKKLLARPWTWIHGVVVLTIVAGFYLTRLFLGLLLQSEVAPPEANLGPPPVGLFVVETLSFPLVSLTIVLLLLRRQGASLKNAFGIEFRAIPKNIFQAGTFYFAMMPILVTMSFFYVLFLVSLGYPIERQAVVQWFTDPNFPAWTKIFLTFLAVIVAPVVEELLFRGIAIPAFAKTMGPRTSVVLVSLLFAAIHMHVPSLLPLFIVALTLALAYLYSGSLLVPILLHALFNGINLAGALLLKDAPNVAWFVI